MDIEKYLIMLKNEDKTLDIKEYRYEDDKVWVTFKENSKVYSYAKSNFKIYSNPKEIEIDNVEKTLDIGDIYNVNKILLFDSYCRIIFDNGKFETIPFACLNIREKPQESSENKFKYFKEISEIVSLKTDDDISLLTKEYEKISIVDKKTALYTYLNPQTTKIKNLKYVYPLIFPFGSNESQYKAVENAIKNQISVIEGPPGTGKTQTILNIIANIIIQGKSVAVVSNNNSATDNVFEKLVSNDLGFICATLGKKENKEKFIETQREEYPNIDYEYIEDDIGERISALNKKLAEMFKLENDRANYRQMLNDVKKEHEYYRRYCSKPNSIKVRNIMSLNPNTIMNLRVELEHKEQEGKKLDIWFKLKARYFYGIGDFRFYKLPIKDIMEKYADIYFFTKENDLMKKISNISEKLNYSNSKDALEELKKYSSIYLKKYLCERYCLTEKRNIFNIKDLHSKADQFIKEYPVIFSTTYSIKESLFPDMKYDYIIMDEASQVDLITGTLALSCAKNAVIVGDRKQLPNVVSTENRKQVEEVMKKYNIKDNYNFLKESFLTSIINTIKDIPMVLLKEHYRCDPKIIGFSNEKFYDNKLVILTEDSNDKDTIKVYITVKGNHARGHFNKRQIDVIRQEVLPELTNKVDISEIGIVSPYNAQKDGMKDIAINNEMQIDTVHKFQGREKDAIIITTVDNQISDFVDDPKMLNVAVTRAKKYLRLVVSDDVCNSNSNVNDLIKYIQYNNFELVKSNVKSIYDLLYKNNREQRLEYLKNKKRISDYDSENITYNVIKEIITENEFDNLDIVSHIPFASLLSNLDLLTNAEKKYVTNEWTHIDFVIYNKMDKKMVMAVEVDGYYFHRKETIQQQRDNLKNNILEKYNIPLLRLKTVGSEELEILKDKMIEVFR